VPNIIKQPVNSNGSIKGEKQMMDFTQALDTLADKTGIHTQSIDYEDATNIIMDIYDSIGSCKECKHDNYDVSCNMYINRPIIQTDEFEWQFENKSNFYCGYFERRKNDN
jgi:hypothetical protein